MFYVLLTYHISFYSTHRTNRLLTPEAYQEWRSYVQMLVTTGLALSWPAIALVYIVELQTHTPEVERAFGALAYLLFCLMNIPFEVLALSSSWFIAPRLPRPLGLLILLLLLAQVMAIGLSFYPRSEVGFGLVVVLQIIWHILIGAFLWLEAETLRP
jgi:hypothetical protein